MIIIKLGVYGKTKEKRIIKSHTAGRAWPRRNAVNKHKQKERTITEDGTQPKGCEERGDQDPTKTEHETMDNEWSMDNNNRTGTGRTNKGERLEPKKQTQKERSEER